MNTWGYLIAIAALLLLSAFMLYARFATRSREKSLHHAPQDAALVSATLVDSPPEEFSFHGGDEEGALALDIKPVPSALEDLAVEEEVEEKYLDELQEAAAGLAMLMRSSPVQKKADPVVFAPDVADADDVTEEMLEEDRVSSEHGAKVDEDLSSMGEAIDRVEAILDAPPVFEEESSRLNETLVEPKGDLRGILGEDVMDRFAHLDHSLDDLEILVREMEGELVHFEEFLQSPTGEDSSIAA